MSVCTTNVLYFVGRWHKFYTIIGRRDPKRYYDFIIIIIIFYFVLPSGPVSETSTNICRRFDCPPEHTVPGGFRPSGHGLGLIADCRVSVTDGPDGILFVAPISHKSTVVSGFWKVTAKAVCRRLRTDLYFVTNFWKMLLWPQNYF